MSKLSAFASTIKPHLGAIVAVTAKDSTVTDFKIAKLSDKLGSLKNGDKGEYVVLQSLADKSVVINLHPASAQRLIKNGTEAGMVLAKAPEATDTPAAADAPADAPVEKVKKAAKVKAPKVEAEPAEPAEPKAPSKKDQFMTAYNAGVAAGSDRKTIKAAVAGLAISDACFNTYYQNAKSGKWA